MDREKCARHSCTNLVKPGGFCSQCGTKLLKEEPPKMVTSPSAAAAAAAATTPVTPRPKTGSGFFSFKRNKSMLLTLETEGHTLKYRATDFGFSAVDVADPAGENVVMVTSVQAGGAGEAAGLVPGMQVKALTFKIDAKSETKKVTSASELVIFLQQATGSIKVKVVLNEPVFARLRSNSDSVSSLQSPPPVAKRIEKDGDYVHPNMVNKPESCSEDEEEAEAPSAGAAADVKRDYVDLIEGELSEAPPVYDKNKHALPKWYAPDISAQQAEDRLRISPLGAFIVRPSSSRPGNYALAVRTETKVEHIHVEKTPHNTYCVSRIKEFSSLEQLIAFYQSEPLSVHFSAVSTTLRQPVGDEVYPALLQHAATAPQANVPVPKSPQLPKKRAHSNPNPFAPTNPFSGNSANPFDESSSSNPFA